MKERIDEIESEVQGRYQNLETPSERRKPTDSNKGSDRLRRIISQSQIWKTLEKREKASQGSDLREIS